VHLKCVLLEMETNCVQRYAKTENTAERYETAMWRNKMWVSPKRKVCHT
jgi:hypothetical protein